jgi:hypothetical protein
MSVRGNSNKPLLNLIMGKLWQRFRSWRKPGKEAITSRRLSLFKLRNFYELGIPANRSREKVTPPASLLLNLDTRY